MSGPEDLAVDASGNLYVASETTDNAFRIAFPEIGVPIGGEDDLQTHNVFVQRLFPIHIPRRVLVRTKGEATGGNDKGKHSKGPEIRLFAMIPQNHVWTHEMGRAHKG